LAASGDRDGRREDPAASQRVTAAQQGDAIAGSVSKVEMATPMALIYKVLFPSMSTFETPPTR
jgi:hypothetical protein